MTELPIIPLTGLDLRFEPAPWPFADERRAEIDAHFAKLRAEKPQCGTGACCCCAAERLPAGVLSGAYSEVDFASFVAWRDWDFPDKSVRNCFAMAALRSADGAFLLGEMGAHTATAGQIYFPAGTPDRHDLVGDTVDLERGVMRELAEETGLTLADVVPESGWTAVLEGQRIALMKIVQAKESADALAARIRTYLSHKSSRNSRTCTSCER